MLRVYLLFFKSRECVTRIASYVSGFMEENGETDSALKIDHYVNTMVIGMA